MIFKLFLFLLALFSCIQIHGQNKQKLDSLWTAFKQAEHDTTRIKTYLNIGEVYNNIYPDTALLYYQKALDIADKVPDSAISAIPNSPEYKLFSLKVTSLLYIGSAHRDRGSYDKAIEYYSKALKISEELKDKRRMSHCYGNIGIIHKNLGNYDRAVEYYNKSLKISEELGDKKGMSTCYSSIGVVQSNQCNYDKAIEYYLKALKINEELGNKKGISTCYNNLGVVLKNQGNYKKAIEYYLSSLKIFEELGDKRGMSQCYINIGIVYSDQGSYDMAIMYYLKSLKIAEELGFKMVMSQCYNNIGNVHSDQGSYDMAIEYYLKSLKIDEELGDKWGVSTCLINIGIVYRNQGGYDMAIEYFLKSLKIREEQGDKSGVSGCYFNIGNIHNLQGNYNMAIEYYQKSLKIDEELADKRGISHCYGSIGIVLYDQGSYDMAIEYYLKSLKILEELEDKNGIAVVCSNIQALHIKHADSFEHQRTDSLSILEIDTRMAAHLDTALDFGNKAYKIATEIGTISMQKSSLLGFSRINIGKNNFLEALNNLNDLINLDNDDIIMNFSFISENEKENYFKIVEDHYYELYSFALKHKNENPSAIINVFDNVIKNKGLLLKSSTAMKNGVLNSGDTVLIGKYNDWVVLKKQISLLYSQGNDKLNKNLDSLEKIANAMERDLVKSSQIFSDFEKLQEISWRDVQKRLKSDETAIEFINFKWKGESLCKFTDTILYCALIIKPECQFPEMIQLFDERKLEKILSQNTNNSIDFIERVYGNSNSQNYELYNIIWKPLEESLKGIQTVYISSSGLLHKISFAALRNNNNEFLCDKYNLELLSSTIKLVIPDNSTYNDTVTISVFGGINYNSDSSITQIWPYLEGTKQEAQNIEKLFLKKKTDVKWFSDTTATEETFKHVAANSKIIHIATHGFFFPDPETEWQKDNLKQNDTTTQMVSANLYFRGSSAGFGVWKFIKNKNPLMRSGLVLAGANDVWNRTETSYKDDGVLTAQEVLNIDMRRTDLVVLSACETGLGDIRGSEGVYGLQRAFKMAGVKYIIMSLWQVPDKETVEFMETFYKKLLKEKDVRQAFNETQKEMRKKYDPYYWAAFVLVE